MTSKKTFTIVGVICLIAGAVLLLLGGNTEEDMVKIIGFVIAGAGVVAVAWKFIRDLIDKDKK